MDLDLDSIRTTGRARRSVSAEVVRALDTTDLVLLTEEKGSKPSALKRISERHHALARLLAQGTPPGEAGIITGYDASRVSILQADPSFKELVVFYRQDVNREAADLRKEMFGLSVDATRALRDRLEDSIEDFSVGQLLEVAKMGADRTGHGPSSTTTNLNVNVDLANRLEAARKRVADRKFQVIEGTKE